MHEGWLGRDRSIKMEVLRWGKKKRPHRQDCSRRPAVGLDGPPETWSRWWFWLTGMVLSTPRTKSIPRSQSILMSRSSYASLSHAPAANSAVKKREINAEIKPNTPASKPSGPPETNCRQAAEHYTTLQKLRSPIIPCCIEIDAGPKKFDIAAIWKPLGVLNFSWGDAKQYTRANRGEKKKDWAGIKSPTPLNQNGKKIKHTTLS